MDGELSYASDIDVLFVYDGDSPEDFDSAEHARDPAIAEVGATHERRPDLPDRRRAATRGQEGRARPFTRRIPLVLRGVRADVGVPVAAAAPDRSPATSVSPCKFLKMVEPFVYRDPFPEDEAREVRRVKVRVERERIPPGEDPSSTSSSARAPTDIEFTVQLLQLEHGKRPARGALRGDDRGVAPARRGRPARPGGRGDARASYRFCERARNARYLVTGKPGDALPNRRSPSGSRALWVPAPPAGQPARRLPAGDPPGPAGRRAGLLRPNLTGLRPNSGLSSRFPRLFT